MHFGESGFGNTEPGPPDRVTLWAGHKQTKPSIIVACFAPSQLRALILVNGHYKHGSYQCCA